MKLWIPLLAAAAAALLFAASSTASPSRRHNCRGAREAIKFYSTTTRQWESRHDAPLTPVSAAASSPGCAYVRWASHAWQVRSRSARRAYDAWFAMETAKWACIHHREGSWTAHNSGYGGGLQMDAGFQNTYGHEFLARYGAAGAWPVWAQYLAADRAFHGYNGHAARYFGPWPNTARACGL